VYNGSLAGEKNWQTAMDIKENVGRERAADMNKLADGGGVI